MAGEFSEDFSEMGFFVCSDGNLPAPLSSDLPIMTRLQCPKPAERRKMVASNTTISAKTRKKDSSRKGVRRGKREEDEAEVVEMKSKEVVHVRAKRGQATDSHSLAERMRREKINEKMRCLQDLVPGCYKAMGTAVLLDEIINYVQSLQNQIEFLSMKLSAASAVAEGDVAAQWPSMAALRCPSSRLDGWDLPLPPAPHSEIIVNENSPLSINVHQLPQWYSE